MAPKLGGLYATIKRVVQDPRCLIVDGQYIGQPAVYLVSPSKLNLCVILNVPIQGVNQPLTSWILTDIQAEQVKSGRAALGKNSSLANYGPLLYSIYHCDDCHELQTLADEYLNLYKRLGTGDQYKDKEKRTLSDFFCECDEYSPDDDEIWETKDARTSVNSTQLRKAASRTLTQLEVYA